MKWLKNKLRQWVFEEREQDVLATSPKRGINTVSRRQLESRGMNFTVYQANGGNIIEYSHYDEKTDRHYHRLHIIPSDDDLGQGIAHIITLEMLRN
jgi:hypothetical protein